MDAVDLIELGDHGFNLPFYYPPEETLNSPSSCQLYQSAASGVAGVDGVDDRANGGGGEGAAVVGYPSQFSQSNGSNAATAARMVEARRSSIEQALYGSCMKGTSCNTLVSKDPLLVLLSLPVLLVTTLFLHRVGYHLVFYIRSYRDDLETC